MNSIQLKSRAKINLSIDVLGKREDGYHLVEMIMQTIDLYDRIKISALNEDKIVIKSKSLDIPLNDDNIVYKAANLIKNKFNINSGVEIYIEKNIPVAAGMAGGSSNAAGVLVGLNKLWNLGLSEEELKAIGLKLGADVPFCISGQAALAENIGEKLTKIDGLDEDTFILVCKPELFVSTKEIYEEIDSKEIKRRPDNKLLINLLKEKDIEGLSRNMYNVLEEVTKDKYPVIDKIEQIMMQNNALGSMMSGSGPTVFGLYSKLEDAERCKEILLQEFKQVYVVKSNNKGVELDG
ncbi:4-(cytidine 5'-diphospho)-2-C-methyl-D-erythritol kinase [Terrisporobacter sp.]|uniref:4-(cytidine 5'-diphospho)-2-C-methyl-D-erythritol kinase n=1 Tax=Terrisporobacter sp. TaxID=1965305 RepID=UPI00262EDFC2|nr:4-(cytidine 5'-diphospho)-2-C-methyl-D-erythritol kinase [Terrisporobacter sp.]